MLQFEATLRHNHGRPHRRRMAIMHHTIVWVGRGAEVGRRGLAVNDAVSVGVSRYGIRLMGGLIAFGTVFSVYGMQIAVHIPIEPSKVEV